MSDSIKLAIKEGGKILLKASGSPAETIAYGIVAAVAVVGYVVYYLMTEDEDREEG